MALEMAPEFSRSEPTWRSTPSDKSYPVTVCAQEEHAYYHGQQPKASGQCLQVAIVCSIARCSRMVSHPSKAGSVYAATACAIVACVLSLTVAHRKLALFTRAMDSVCSKRTCSDMVSHASYESPPHELIYA